MMDVIQKLLVIQDRDRRINRLQAELELVPRQREAMLQKDQSARANLEAAKNRVKELESSRKQLDLEVQAKQELIERYANQQLQTRKNEEYRALAHEIETCRAKITAIEDREIELMEEGEAAQKVVAESSAAASAAKELVDGEVAALQERAGNLERELKEVEQDRARLADGVDEAVLNRYERLLVSKGYNVVVGVHNGVCGGCHMKLPAQELVLCKAGEEIVTCINCGRILYYTRDMSLVAED